MKIFRVVLTSDDLVIGKKVDSILFQLRLYQSSSSSTHLIPLVIGAIRHKPGGDSGVLSEGRSGYTC